LAEKLTHDIDRTAATANDDPIVTKSLALHYVVATVVLMATLFWAMWDENTGQRPWKTFQSEWRERYTLFLKTARSNSSNSQKEVESNSEYQALKEAYDRASQNSAPRIREINEKLRDLSAKILAVQNVFTDRRAYVNALTYTIETSGSSNQSKQKELEEYKQELATVQYADGSTQKYTYPQLEEAYNSLKDQRTNLGAELAELIKPLNEQKQKLDAYVSDRMVDLTPTQLAGLQNRTEAWDAKLVQINVAEANIVDRCESCHLGIREPVKLTATAMAPKEKKTGRIRPRVYQSSRTGTIEKPRPRQIWLLAMPSRKWPRHHER